MVCGRVRQHGLSDVPPLALFLHKVGQRCGVGGGDIGRRHQVVIAVLAQCGETVGNGAVLGGYNGKINAGGTVDITDQRLLDIGDVVSAQVRGNITFLIDDMYADGFGVL